MVKTVQQYNVFYQTGMLQTWDLVCEPFEYAGEHLNTGIEDVDAIEAQLSMNTSSRGLLITPTGFLLDDDGFPLLISSLDLDTNNLDFFSDSEEINEEVDDLVDFSEDNPFSENI